MWLWRREKESYTDTCHGESGRIGLCVFEELEQWRMVPKAPLQVSWGSTEALDFSEEMRKGWT